MHFYLWLLFSCLLRSTYQWPPTRQKEKKCINMSDHKRMPLPIQVQEFEFNIARPGAFLWWHLWFASSLRGHPWVECEHYTVITDDHWQLVVSCCSGIAWTENSSTHQWYLILRSWPGTLRLLKAHHAIGRHCTLNSGLHGGPSLRKRYGRAGSQHRWR